MQLLQTAEIPGLEAPSGPLSGYPGASTSQVRFCCRRLRRHAGALPSLDRGTAHEKAVYGDAGAEAESLRAVSRKKEKKREPKKREPDVALARSYPTGPLAAQV